MFPYRSLAIICSLYRKWFLSRYFFSCGINISIFANNHSSLIQQSTSCFGLYNIMAYKYIFCLRTPMFTYHQTRYSHRFRKDLQIYQDRVFSPDTPFSLTYLSSCFLMLTLQITQVNRMSRSRRVLAIGGKHCEYGWTGSVFIHFYFL